jgi:hypothetical protein
LLAANSHFIASLAFCRLFALVTKHIYFLLVEFKFV